MLVEARKFNKDTPRSGRTLKILLQSRDGTFITPFYRVRPSMKSRAGGSKVPAISTADGNPELICGRATDADKLPGA